MKTLLPSRAADLDAQLIARFGAARLVRLVGGRYELRGGTAPDHLAAKEWISLFLHEACPVILPSR